MNRLLVAFVAAISFGAVGVPPIFAQGVERTEAIASSDILSQISMFNYREGPKSDIKFRPTPIATNGKGEAEIEYEDGNARIAVRRRQSAGADVAWGRTRPTCCGPSRPTAAPRTKAC